MKIKKIVSIILVIAWMLVVFFFSQQQGTGSSGTSQKVANKIIEIVDIKKQFSQEKTQELVQQIEPYIRKIAHYSVYLLGGILITYCLSKYTLENKKLVMGSAIWGVTYAVTDEMHQLFIAGRSGRLVDVWIDSLGVLTGILIFLLFLNITIRIRKSKGVE